MTERQVRFFVPSLMALTYVRRILTDPNEMSGSRKSEEVYKSWGDGRSTASSQLRSIPVLPSVASLAAPYTDPWHDALRRALMNARVPLKSAANAKRRQS